MIWSISRSSQSIAPRTQPKPWSVPLWKINLKQIWRGERRKMLRSPFASTTATSPWQYIPTQLLLWGRLSFATAPGTPMHAIGPFISPRRRLSSGWAPPEQDQHEAGVPLSTREQQKFAVPVWSPACDFRLRRSYLARYVSSGTLLTLFARRNWSPRSRPDQQSRMLIK